MHCRKGFSNLTQSLVILSTESKDIKPSCDCHSLAKKKITLTHNPFLLILTTQNHSMLHSDSSYRSGNNENYGKEYEDTDVLLNSNCYNQDLTGLQRKQGRTSASKRDFIMFGDFTYVYNSLHKENFLIQI